MASALTSPTTAENSNTTAPSAVESSSTTHLTAHDVEVLNCHIDEYKMATKMRRKAIRKNVLEIFLKSKSVTNYQTQSLLESVS